MFCRASDQSKHKEWITPANDQNFDLFIEYYGDTPNRYSEDCKYYSYNKAGSKWVRFHDLILKNQDIILEYDAVMIADDDVSMNATTIRDMFHIFTQHNLMLAQPALGWDSYYAHEITHQNPKYLLRYTNWVEGMVPIFSKDTLKLCWPTFNKSKTGWGLDFIWPKLLNYPKDKIAVIDATPVRHTRPAGHGDLYYTTNVNPWQELGEVTRPYGIQVPPWNFEEYGGITR